MSESGVRARLNSRLGFLMLAAELVTCFLATRRWGWGWEAFRAEASQGAGLPLPGAFRLYMRWVLPVILLGVLVGGLAMQ